MRTLKKWGLQLNIEKTQYIRVRKETKDTMLDNNENIKQCGDLYNYPEMNFNKKWQTEWK